MTKQLSAALEIAANGWHVFPCTHDKKPIIETGFKAATTDSDQIHRWWQRNPNAWIGVATGKVSGIWVVDIDIKNTVDGAKSLHAHFGNNIVVDEKSTLIAGTPSGGYHLYFNYKNPVNTRAGVLKGVDIRGDGGFVIAPPSSFKAGMYSYNKDDFTTIDAPRWAIELATLRVSKKHGQVSNINELLTNGASEGSRNTDIFTLVRSLEHSGVEQDIAVRTALYVANICTPPFDEIETMNIVERVYTKFITHNGSKIRNSNKQAALQQQINQLQQEGST